MSNLGELDFDWGDILSKADPKKAEPPKVSATIYELKEHNCKRNHKTNETFVKCALRRYSYNNVDKASLPEIIVKGSGDWMTVHESLSEIYYSYSYETEQEYEHQYKILECHLFETLEEAAEWRKYQHRFCNSGTGCSFSCNSLGVWGYVSKIVL